MRDFLFWWEMFTGLDKARESNGSFKTCGSLIDVSERVTAVFMSCLAMSHLVCYVSHEAEVIGV